MMILHILIVSFAIFIILKLWIFMTSKHQDVVLLGEEQCTHHCGSCTSCNTEEKINELIRKDVQS